MIRETIAKFLLVCFAILGFTIFLGLYLFDGYIVIRPEIILYENNPIIRLAELILYSGLLGFSIYLFVNFVRRH